MSFHRLLCKQVKRKLNAPIIVLAVSGEYQWWLKNKVLLREQCSSIIDKVDLIEKYQ
jgi:hypothetical protein